MNVSKEEILQEFAPEIELIKQVMCEDEFKIYGGFPRDIYIGKMPKDIDVWIEGTDLNIFAVKNMLDKLDYFYQNKTKNYGPPTGIVDIISPVGRRIDFMFTNDTPERHMKLMFDFNINQFELVNFDEVFYRGKHTLTNFCNNSFRTASHRAIEMRALYDKYKDKFSPKVEEDEPKKSQTYRGSEDMVEAFRKAKHAMFDGEAKQIWKVRSDYIKSNELLYRDY